MGLEIGIVGLPNVGKSTLFNALLRRQVAFAANYPFATIEPNVGVVSVPDERLKVLAEVVMREEGLGKMPPLVPATVKFVDIAGLVAGASKGEGLGNKFLSHIREVDAVAHVIRGFDDPLVVSTGSGSLKKDRDIVETELLIADLESVERAIEHRTREFIANKKLKSGVDKIYEVLKKGSRARGVLLDDEENRLVQDLHLLTSKPFLYVVNADERKLSLEGEKKLKMEYAQVLGVLQSELVVISAKVEAEMSELAAAEQIEFLKEMNLNKSGLDRFIGMSFEMLGLMTFLTAGAKEVRAWTIKRGIAADKAAGVIHGDFEKHFIKAEVVTLSDFVNYGGWRGARGAGRARFEGRDYVMKDGDVVEFKVGV